MFLNKILEDAQFMAAKWLSVAGMKNDEF